MEKETYSVRKPFMVVGEHAVKPYFYYRNGMLHVTYKVDRAIRLSRAEAEELKARLEKTDGRADLKQDELMDTWKFQVNQLNKEVYYDGLSFVDESMEKARNGRKD